MATSICFRCGAAKCAWSMKCRECALDPRGDMEAMAKSYILSAERYDAGSDPSEQMGLPEFDELGLDAIGSRIRAGEAFEFHQEQVGRVVEALRVVDQATGKDSLKAFWAVMRWLAPLWIVIAIGLLLLFWR